MENKQLKKALALDWQPWLKRDFFAFLISIFRDGGSKKSFARIGLPGWEEIAFMFDNGEWYWSEEVYNLVEPQIKEWTKTHHISEITDRQDVFYVRNKTKILKLAKNPERKTREKLQELIAIFTGNASFIWAAHVLDHYYSLLLQKEVKKYIGKNIDKFIGDASYPEKKNKLEQMDDEIRQGTDYKTLASEYGWMRSRDGFARGFNAREIADHAKTVKAPHQHNYPLIPPRLKKIFSEARELVYFRTQRTDVYYEFLFLARPIFRAIAKKYKIPFSDLKYYDIHSLASGRPVRYPKNFGSVCYKNKLFLFHKPIFSAQGAAQNKMELKGTVAQPGIIRGTAKIVMKVSELNKVKKGDILLTAMTSPNFLPAMKLSAGFVTDEGGLTCHAAIIAREIKKPCLIGTRLATRTFRDGDFIEVNANQGIVKLLKRAG